VTTMARAKGAVGASGSTWRSRRVAAEGLEVCSIVPAESGIDMIVMGFGGAARFDTVLGRGRQLSSSRRLGMCRNSVLAYMRLEICSEIKPIRKIRALVTKSNALMLVNRPVSRKVHR
jgi:hypothetical protein